MPCRCWFRKFSVEYRAMYRTVSKESRYVDYNASTKAIWLPIEPVIN
jgi:hypothetical protein